MCYPVSSVGTGENFSAFGLLHKSQVEILLLSRKENCDSTCLQQAIDYASAICKYLPGKGSSIHNDIFCVAVVKELVNDSVKT